MFCWCEWGISRIFMIFIEAFFTLAIVLYRVFNCVLKEIPDCLHFALFRSVIGQEAWSASLCDWSRSLKRWKMGRLKLELV